ncbi:MAG: two-component system sensor histidine kinase CreC [Proteobacteria bacterium]|nr:MAG: two-component system sensor histidine kinase CreC [Pseudomonadota bacterium]
MRLGVGIFLGYLLIAILAGYFVMNVFVDEIKPSARQAMEDSLVDAANLLAEIATDDFKAGNLQDGDFAKRVAAYQARQLNASIWGFDRRKPGFRIYITDETGIVRFDSSRTDLGKDYSRWNDVYLTLRGGYGVRSSPLTETLESGDTSMHVAAPIKESGRIVGVLTLVKSNNAVEPFIQRTKDKIVKAGYGLLTASLLIGLIISFWLSASVQKLVRYSQAVTRGERASLPRVSLTEVKRLGESIELMRERLEGKRYVEDYIATLTHEMKSPITAIQASSELLLEEMPDAQRQKFIFTITDQTKRLHVLIEKMLQQATIENRQTLEVIETFDLKSVLQRVTESSAGKLAKKQITLHEAVPPIVMLAGDAFLICQAFTNILDNAIDFSPKDSIIELVVERVDSNWEITFRDHGPGVPDYAKDKIFDRYYSLPRPENGTKSTGLGLAFVQQVMTLHRGKILIQNHSEGGVVARLILPVNV